jgi:nitroimidazol reductase NimA-like FMN-containing flavoprotein (pyridoxamine 5'-phosphate oxidase superfamily)
MFKGLFIRTSTDTCTIHPLSYWHSDQHFHHHLHCIPPTTNTTYTTNASNTTNTINITNTTNTTSLAPKHEHNFH